MLQGGAFLSFFFRNRGTALSTAAAAAAAIATSWGLTVGADPTANAYSLRSEQETPSGAAVSAPTSSATKASASSETLPASGVSSTAQLPVEKLSCKAASSPPRTPLVLVCCGSFNPPTVMHMRMVDLAGEELMRRGYDVWGAYLSPVADSYGKPGLVPAPDRVAMCRLAAAEPTGHRSDPEPDLTMVYDWEARQPGYTRTLAVLRRVESELQGWLGGAGPGAVADGSVVVGAGAEAAASHAASGPPPPAAAVAPPRNQGMAPQPHHLPHRQPQAQPQGLQPQAQPKGLQPQAQPLAQPQGLQLQAQPQGLQPEVRAMLLCGGDVLASMATPGVWRDPDVILRNHGVVCVVREGTDLERLLDRPGTVLYDYRDRVVLVYDRVGNSVSSSKVRKELAAGRPVRHLVAPGVLSYIYEKRLYGARWTVVGQDRSL